MAISLLMIHAIYHVQIQLVIPAYVTVKHVPMDLKQVLFVIVIVNLLQMTVKWDNTETEECSSVKLALKVIILT